MYTSIKKENPYAMFITGDFNGHSQLWWPLGDTTPEGNPIEEMVSLLGLSQLIKDPTNLNLITTRLVLILFLLINQTLFLRVVLVRHFILSVIK